jgi:hypothetical protein
MTETLINLTDWQADAAAKGRLTQITLPMQPQPTWRDCDHWGEEWQNAQPGWLWPPSAGPYDRHARWRADYDPTVILRDLCPYPPGTVLVGRAARHRWTVTAVSVRRVGDLTGDELAAEGFPPDDSPELHDGVRLTLTGRKMCFAEHWDARYGKCCPYDSNPWAWVLDLKPEKV